MYRAIDRAFGLNVPNLSLVYTGSGEFVNTTLPECRLIVATAIITHSCPFIFCPLLQDLKTRDGLEK